MKYHLYITGSDPIGFNFLENVIAMANLGATLKEGTLPTLRFPQAISMSLEAETPPTPNAFIRVFEDETGKEVFAAFVPEVAASFSMDAVKVDKSLNGDVPWTKEQLDGMDWESEFKVVMESAGIDGKRRAKMTSDYLAKFIK